MEIKKITQKEIWEKFFEGQKEKTFLQSWAWGEFQEKSGNKIWRLGIYGGLELIMVALIVAIKARRGTFLLIQHLSAVEPETIRILLEELKKIGQEEKTASQAAAASRCGRLPIPVARPLKSAIKESGYAAQDDAVKNFFKVIHILKVIRRIAVCPG